jgi:hypothetical protein
MRETACPFSGRSRTLSLYISEASLMASRLKKRNTLVLTFLTFRGRASYCTLIMKANYMHYFSNLFDKVLYMFRTSPLSIIRSISTLYTRNRHLSCQFCWLSASRRVRGGVVVKALRYKPACFGFDSRWCHWNFSVT